VATELYSLMVAEQYQRQGVGSALLTTVLGSVDASGLPCLLRASERGRQLYPKLGWKTVELIDLADEDGRVVYQWPVMVREAAK
jgi:GNAT superfamily N-acetyltransferase